MKQMFGRVGGGFVLAVVLFAGYLIGVVTHSTASADVATSCHKGVSAIAWIPGGSGGHVAYACVDDNIIH
jgi:hypothetical protein